ncbi:MAG: hypothetical protein HYT16_02005 [DPANN group archaeon]|nr:hypothetical protein [DPANN group archaeon]
MGKATLLIIAIIILAAAGLIALKFSGGITSAASAPGNKAESFVSNTNRGTCADSDSDNYKAKGVTIAKSPDGLLSFTDKCVSASVLLEGLCERGELTKKQVNCDCKDGVCA